MAAHATGLLLPAPGRAGHQGPRRTRAPRRRRARGDPGAPSLPRRADAAVDPSQGGRGSVRPELRPRRRCRALPARLVGEVAGHGRGPSEASSCGRRCAGPAVVPPPQGPAQGWSPSMSLPRTTKHLQGLRRRGRRRCMPSRALSSRSTRGRWWPSWAPAAPGRAPC